MKINQVPSPNFDSRADNPISLLLLHYTGMQTGQEALERLCDPAAKVSAHYLIEEDGAISALVPEHERAWHAGVACWRGQQNINAISIGIELVNPGHEFGYRPFPEQQISALIELSADIVRRHTIPPAGVIGHSDVAPSRKEDPGELFPWERLAGEGLGIWPSGPQPDMPPGLTPDLAHLIERLETIGYASCPAKEEAARPTITAFQRHWLPEAIGTNEEGQASPRTLMRASAVAGLVRKGHGAY